MHARLGRCFGWLVCLSMAAGACATSDSSQGEPRYRIVKNDTGPVAQQGIPPDIQSDILMMLQQRQPTAQKCYQDVLNEKNDRGFQGSVKIVIALATGGAPPKVRIDQSTLHSPEVERCLVEKIQGFDFPPIEQGGELQHEYLFRPAY